LEEEFHFVGWDLQQTGVCFGEFIELIVERLQPALGIGMLEFAEFFHELEPLDADLFAAVALGEFRGIACARIHAQCVNEAAQLGSAFHIQLFFAVLILRHHRLANVRQQAEFGLGDAEFLAEVSGAAFGFHGLCFRFPQSGRAC